MLGDAKIIEHDLWQVCAGCSAGLGVALMLHNLQPICICKFAALSQGVKHVS
jgi:hypothetical protein